MQHRSRRLAAAFLLMAIGFGAALGGGPGLLVPHQLPPAPDTSGLPPVGTTVPEGTVPGVPDASASGAPAAPALGLPVASDPRLAALSKVPLPAALGAAFASPYDALLVGTGSGSGLALAYHPNLGDPSRLAAGEPGTPIGDLALLDRLAAAAGGLRGDPQRLLLEAAPVAGLTGQRAAYQHAVGPDSLERAVLEVYDSLGLQPSAEVRLQLHEDALAVSDELRDGVALVLFAVADAQRSVAKAMAELEPEEYQLLWECARPTDEPFGNACADPIRAAAIADAKLDRAALATAALEVLSAFQQAEPMLQAFQEGRLQATKNHQAEPTPTAESEEPPPSDDVDLFADPLRLVQVGGYGNDVYYGNALLDGGDVSVGLSDARAQVFTLDFSGNDLYLARAGGTAPNPLLAVGDGSKEIGAPRPTDLLPHQDKTVTWGSLVSVSIDYSGNDYYSGGVGYQGSGTLGVGLLLELDGDDRYTATSASQGAGDAGIGLLFDAAGRDTYASQYRSQGYGTVGGLGILLDAAGDDRYTGAVLMQGAGSNGGAGMLVDAQGNDYYYAVTGGTTASQGASHLVGVGLFADGGGFDAYTSSAGARGFIFPAPAPYSVGTGLFLDRGMVDTYSSAPGANGGTWPGGSSGYGVDRS